MKKIGIREVVYWRESMVYVQGLVRPRLEKVQLGLPWRGYSWA
jgi:hypothetical protein